MIATLRVINHEGRWVVWREVSARDLIQHFVAWRRELLRLGFHQLRIDLELGGAK
jgi:hypothetical protein